MNMTENALEVMATILRENGYEISFKEPDTKKPYIRNRFNKIYDLDLKSLGTDTCLFLDSFAVEDIESGAYVVGSSSATIGYLDITWDDTVIKTNRTDSEGNYITEKLKKYSYVIKLKDVVNLMVDNEDFSV